MPAFKNLVDENRRLAILQLFQEAGGDALNEDVLIRGLDFVGHPISRDALLSLLAWLEEQGLVEQRTVSSLVVAKVTRCGLDVAAGKARVPGVDAPALR